MYKQISENRLPNSRKRIKTIDRNKSWSFNKSVYKYKKN